MKIQELLESDLKTAVELEHKYTSMPAFLPVTEKDLLPIVRNHLMFGLSNKKQ